MPEETNVEEEQPIEPVKKSGSAIGKMLMVVILALASSAGGGVVSWVLISKTLGTHAPAGEKASEDAEEEKLAEMLEKGAVLPLEPFVVNLADTDAARYLRIKVSLMVDDKTKMSHIIENEALQLKVRDVILQSLTAKTSHELVNADGKNKLRHEILEKVTVYFREPKLLEVMFTEFVIQL